MVEVEGTCHGGPLDGQRAASRFPKGFLLVDKPAGHCWIYEWNAEKQTFHVRSDEPMPVHEDGAFGYDRYRAAAEPNYDVLAAPWVGK
jgi:hypothetical protein